MILEDHQKFASPEEALAHFGVKGMRWGVRRERARNLTDLTKGESIVRTTKNGDQFTLSPKPPTKLDKALAAASSSYANKFGESAHMTIQDKAGKKIGTANFWHHQKERDAVYLNWITIDKHARGNGYASAVLHAAEEHSRAAGKKRMILEVPGNAPDARHIYEKMGFKVTKEADPKDAKRDPIWGGLTIMEKQLVKQRRR